MLMPNRVHHWDRVRTFKLSRRFHLPFARQSLARPFRAIFVRLVMHFYYGPVTSSVFSLLIPIWPRIAICCINHHLTCSCSSSPTSSPKLLVELYSSRQAAFDFPASVALLTHSVWYWNYISNKSTVVRPTSSCLNTLTCLTIAM